MEQMLERVEDANKRLTEEIAKNADAIVDTDDNDDDDDGADSEGNN